MKKKLVKSAYLVVCLSVVFCFSSCQMEERSCEKYPELPASVEKKLIKEDVAKGLSEGFIKRIQKLQSLEQTVQKYAQIAKKEQKLSSVAQNGQRNIQSEALKAIFSNETHPSFELSASSYYTLEELESYIEYAKREAAKQKIDLDGFRIYMGLFPDDADYDEKRNFLTVFITPTGRSATQEGAFMTTTMYDGGSDITTIGSLEYGGNGNPPSTSFPNN
ncbi:hypothetical protein [Ascidiimonas sp. W6]|uniref:hypothetical protein n=1 Tax=Ascidiimonas meishanensis TaxID=3128903 RepID=UPI0030ECDD03